MGALTLCWEKSTVSMRILAISDVRRWDSYQQLIRRYRPEVVTLVGDLVYDGRSPVVSDALESIPEFRKRHRLLMKKCGVSGGLGVYKLPRDEMRWREFQEAEEKLKDDFEETPAFDRARKRIHVDKFYDFLRRAGRQAPVLVVKGDHDDAFEGDYDAERINATPGCVEISGTRYEVSGTVFLGLSFMESHYRTKLKELMARFRDRIDILVSHAEQANTPLLGEFGAKLLIRGHFGTGKYLVLTTLAVFTADAHHTVVEFQRTRLPRIRQYIYTMRGKVKELKRGSCKPWFTRESEFERYGWLRPYPVNTTRLLAN